MNESVISQEARNEAFRLVNAIETKARSSDTKTASEWVHNRPIRANITKAGSAYFFAGIAGKRITYDVLMGQLAAEIQDNLNYRARGTRIDMQAEVNYVPGHSVDVTLKGRVGLHLKGTYHRFCVGAVPRGMSGRQEMHGKMVPGPWAFAFGRGAVLSSSKTMQDKYAAEMAVDVVVEEGSKLNIDEVSYTVKVVRGEFIELVANEGAWEGQRS